MSKPVRPRFRVVCIPEDTGTPEYSVFDVVTRREVPCADRGSAVEYAAACEAVGRLVERQAKET